MTSWAWLGVVLVLVALAVVLTYVLVRVLGRER